MSQGDAAHLPGQPAADTAAGSGVPAPAAAPATGPAPAAQPPPVAGAAAPPAAAQPDKGSLAVTVGASTAGVVAGAGTVVGSLINSPEVSRKARRFGLALGATLARTLGAKKPKGPPK